ncbi:hypothetical protein BJV74DRAFT_884634 [Russula compacta]|nr:hypothetical protein BJV74DRAFT_884634 [Russula compacta]
MTIQKSGPNANGVPLPVAGAQVFKNGLPSTLSDIDSLALQHSKIARTQYPDVWGDARTRTGISWTRWDAAFIPTSSNHGTDSMLRQTSLPSHQHSPLPQLSSFLFSRSLLTPPTWALHYYKPFDADILLTLIKHLVALEACWIPRARGCSLYIRSTLIGTRPSLGLSSPCYIALYVILSTMGPYIRSAGGRGSKGIISLLAIGDQVRAWPGGPDGFKLNHAM